MHTLPCRKQLFSISQTTEKLEQSAMVEAFFGIPKRKPKEFNRISVYSPNAPFILDKKKIVIANKRIFIILPFFVKILC
jgi:hypothetical protein